MIINESVLIWLAPVGIVLLVLGFFSSSLKRWYKDWKLRKTINNLGREVVHDVIVSDGMEGSVFIENLILGPKGIIVMVMGQYHGAVFAADSIDMWTQVVGKRSYKFPNPLHKLDQDVAAVKAHAPKCQVDGVILFAKGAEFPKGKPEKLISVADAKAWLDRKKVDEIAPELMACWEKLKTEFNENRAN